MSHGFISNIQPHELRRLREAIKRVHMAHWPERHKTDYECDKIIDALGPEILERRLRQESKQGLTSTRLYVPNALRKRAKV